MHVILAQPRGLCAGVVRAIDMVERALVKHGRPVYVRHEIVHNPYVVDTLRKQGADELTGVPEGEVTIFSAHGVAGPVEKEAQARGLHVIDGTCPLVTKVHNQGRRYVAPGHALILIGHAGHPEVIGTMAQIPGRIMLVLNQADVDGLEIGTDARLAYITQTTLSVDDTRDIIDALKRRFPQIVGPDTSYICYATQNRQAAVRELGRQVEVILVVGARNSSNLLRLWEIASQADIPSYLVASGGEVDPSWVCDVQVIGVTASASAPEAMVEDQRLAPDRPG